MSKQRTCTDILRPNTTFVCFTWTMFCFYIVIRSFDSFCQTQTSSGATQRKNLDITKLWLLKIVYITQQSFTQNNQLSVIATGCRESIFYLDSRQFAVNSGQTVELEMKGRRYYMYLVAATTGLGEAMEKWVSIKINGLKPT